MSKFLYYLAVMFVYCTMKCLKLSENSKSVSLLNQWHCLYISVSFDSHHVLMTRKVTILHLYWICEIEWSHLFQRADDELCTSLWVIFIVFIVCDVSVIFVRLCVLCFVWAVCYFVCCATGRNPFAVQINSILIIIIIIIIILFVLLYNEISTRTTLSYGPFFCKTVCICSWY
jgi:hypothetical protein